MYQGSEYWLLSQVSNSTANEGEILWYPIPPPVDPSEVLTGCRTKAIPSAPPPLHPKKTSTSKLKGWFKFIIILFQTDPAWPFVAWVNWNTLPGWTTAVPLNIKFGVITGSGLITKFVITVPELVTSVYVPALVCQAPCKKILSPSQIDVVTVVVCEYALKAKKRNIIPSKNLFLPISTKIIKKNICVIYTLYSILINWNN